MKAVGYKKSLSIDAADALIDFEIARGEPKGRDIRVAVNTISANPVDYKVRKRAAPPEGQIKILGFDAAGIVEVGVDHAQLGGGRIHLGHERRHLLLRVVGVAQHLALDVVQHAQRVRRVLDLVPGQDLAQVLRRLVEIVKTAAIRIA